MRTDRRTDMTKLVVVLRNFANAPKNGAWEFPYFFTLLHSHLTLPPPPPSGSYIVQPTFRNTRQVYQYLSLSAGLWKGMASRVEWGVSQLKRNYIRVDPRDFFSGISIVILLNHYNFITTTTTTTTTAAAICATVRHETCSHLLLPPPFSPCPATATFDF